jgi:hypothetical protein
MIERAVAAGETGIPPWLALSALMVVSRITRRGRLPSIRRLEMENLRYYRRGLAAGREAVWTSLFAPCELFEAFGLAPVCLEGLVGLLTVTGAEQAFLAAGGTEVLPNTLCTFHRAIAGLGRSGLLPRPLLVASASALCDGNGVSFRHLATGLDLPYAFLDVPPEATTSAVHWLVEQLRDLAGQVERLTGRPLDRLRLSRATRRAREAAVLARRLFEARCAIDRNVFHGHQMINLMLPLNAMVGSAALCRTLGALVRDATAEGRYCRDYRASQTSPGAARLLWAHIAPLYDYNLVWAVLDQGERAKLVAEECSHWDLRDLGWPAGESRLPSGGGDPAWAPMDDFEFVARRLIGIPPERVAGQEAAAARAPAPGGAGRRRGPLLALGVPPSRGWRSRDATVLHRARGAVPELER